MTFTIEQLEKMIVDATPGPWRTYDRCIMANGSTDTYGGPVLGAIASAEDLSACDGDGRNWWTRGNREANAALIAAAPTLATAHIAALKRVAELEALVTTLDPDAFDKFSAACDSSEPAAPFLSIGASK